VSIPVSTTTNVWLVAEVLREQFTHRLQSIDDASPAAADSTELGPSLVLAFAAFVACSVEQPCGHELLLDILNHFTSTYLTSADIHTFVGRFDQDSRKSLLEDYFLALSTLEAHFTTDKIPRSPPSALLTAAKTGKAGIYALFGGQGANEVYFDELKALYDIYKPYVASLIVTISKDVLKPLAVKAETEGCAFYSHGLDVLSWLDGSAPVPPVEYLASIPISFPLIGLTQLVQYLAACSTLNVTPGDMRELIQGSTGHSQGIVSAICIATSTTVASFLENASKALKWLFYSGLRGQEAFPVLTLEPHIVKDAVEGGEGVPTPMLSVTGLALDVLEKHIKGTNNHLPSNSKLAISLYNGPKAFVVTGPAKALYGLVINLRKIRAPTGLDQSKVPFSQRKAVFSTRFLVVGVPYHSPYLGTVSEKVCTVDLEGMELWTAEDLAIPVYHTENGE
jgi:fatty acid synthase subunit alpha, fungi type